MSRHNKTYIGVTTEFKGTHNWPEAPEIAGKGVGFLASEHRHTFYVEVETEVFHDDRDKEFFVFQKDIREALGALYGAQWDGYAVRLGRRSCEQIAQDILNQLESLYKEKLGDTTIKVSEDGEVWARLVSKKND